MQPLSIDHHPKILVCETKLDDLVITKLNFDEGFVKALAFKMSIYIVFALKLWWIVFSLTGPSTHASVQYLAFFKGIHGRILDDSGTFVSGVMIIEEKE